MDILIVDDDPKLWEFLRKGLEEQNYSCSEASTVGQALECLQQDLPAPDLVLLDVMLPDGEGWQVLGELRSRGRDTPVIFLTARSQVDERVRGLEMGADTSSHSNSSEP
ncbi:MAG: response regulator transcription factor [bacterium]|nr:response regulator transcription factor [bacterium]